MVHALEPRGIKEALTSLQRDQWMLAIDKEMDNLRAHDAFHYVPVKEALAQGKKIMRMTWVFKIKTLDTGALDKFKARFCVVGSTIDAVLNLHSKLTNGLQMGLQNP